MSPESHPENDRQIQDEQKRLDELDSKRDNTIDLDNDKDRLTQTYIKRVDKVQGRIRDIYRKIDVQKDMKAPHWQQLESVCLDVEGKLLERLSIIDEENIGRNMAAFNGSIDEYLARLDKTEHPSKSSEDECSMPKQVEKLLSQKRNELNSLTNEKDVMQQQMDTLKEKYGKVIEFLAHSASLDQSWMLDIADLMELRNRTANMETQKEIIDLLIENYHKPALELEAKIQKKSVEIMQPHCIVVAMESQIEREKGNEKLADRMLVKLKEKYGDGGIAALPSALSKKIEAAFSHLKENGDLTDFEHALFGKNPNTLALAVSAQSSAAHGNIDLLDQYQNWGLGVGKKHETAIRVQTAKEKRESKNYWRNNLTVDSFLPTGRSPLLEKLGEFRPVELGKSDNGEVVLVQGEGNQSIIGFRENDGTVHTQNGTTLENSIFKPASVGRGNERLDQIYLTPQAQDMLSKTPYGYQVIPKNKPRFTQVAGWNAPAVRVLNSSDLVYASVDDGKLFVRDGDENLKSVESVSDLEKERTEQSQDVLRALDRDPAVQGCFQRTATLRDYLEGFVPLIQASLDGSGEKDESYVTYTRGLAYLIQQIYEDPSVNENLESAKQSLETLKNSEFGLAARGIEIEIQNRIDAIDRMITLFRDKEEIVKLCTMARDKSVFTSSEWTECAKNSLPKFLAAIALATAAILTVTSGGAATPLFVIAAAGAAGGLVGSELAGEGMHWYHRLLDDEVRSGVATYSDRSLYGGFAEEYTRLVLKEGISTDLLCKAVNDSVTKVAAPYFQQFAVNFAITYATLGAGRFAAGKLSNAKWVRAIANSGKCKELSQSLARIKASYESIANKSLANKFVMETTQEIGEEITEAGIQQGFNVLDARLGFLAGFLLCTAQGIRVRPRVRGLSVDVPSDASVEEAQEALRIQLEALGHEVGVSGEVMKVKMLHGEAMEVEFGREVGADEIQENTEAASTDSSTENGQAELDIANEILDSTDPIVEALEIHPDPAQYLRDNHVTFNQMQNRMQGVESIISGHTELDNTKIDALLDYLYEIAPSANGESENDEDREFYLGTLKRVAQNGIEEFVYDIETSNVRDLNIENIERVLHLHQKYDISATDTIRQSACKYFSVYRKAHPDKILEYIEAFDLQSDFLEKKTQLRQLVHYPEVLSKLKADGRVTLSRNSDQFRQALWDGIDDCVMAGKWASANMLRDTYSVALHMFEYFVVNGLAEMLESDGDLEKFVEGVKSTGIEMNEDQNAKVLKAAINFIVKAHQGYSPEEIKTNLSKGVTLRDHFDIHTDDILEEAGEDFMGYRMKNLQDDLYSGSIDHLSDFCNLYGIEQSILDEEAGKMLRKMSPLPEQSGSQSYRRLKDCISYFTRIRQANIVSEAVIDDALIGHLHCIDPEYIGIEDSFGAEDAFTSFQCTISLLEKVGVPEAHEEFANLKNNAKECALMRLSTGDISTYEKLEKLFEFEQEMKADQAGKLEEATKAGITQLLSETGVSQARNVQERFSVSEEVFTGCVDEAALINLRDAKLGNLAELQELFDLTTVLSSDEAKEAARQGMRPELCTISRNEVLLTPIKGMCELTGLTDADIFNELKAIALKSFEDGQQMSLGLFGMLKEEHDLSAVLVDAEFQQAAQTKIIERLAMGNIGPATKVKMLADIDDVTFKEQGRRAIAKRMQNSRQNNIKIVRELQQHFDLSEELSVYEDQFEETMQGIVSIWDLKTIEDFYTFRTENSQFVEFVLERDEPLAITKEDLPSVSKLHITLLEAEMIKSANADFNLQTSLQNNAYQAVYSQLLQHCEDWKDRENVSEPFEEAVSVFGENDNEGIRRMLAYLDRPDLTRHDGLHAFREIIALQQASGISPNEFYNNILYQVRKTKEQYYEGTAHHHLNAIAQSINHDFDAVLASARQFKGIKKLQELVKHYKNTQKIFESWQNLYLYADRAQIVERSKGLEKLQEYREQGKDTLCDFAETLAFRTDSKVKTSEVMQFVENPGSFLRNGDTHTPDEVHNRKKPSNYTDIPNLDLTAEQLRDSLVEGDLDKLQAFRPLEIHYEIPKNPPLGLRTSMRRALGKRENGKVVGNESPEPQKLFGRMNGVLKQNGLNLVRYLGGEQIPEAKRAKVEEQLFAVLYDGKIGIKKPEVETVKVIAKMNLKSNPDGILAGNDTACCMPFGSGKNNVYMFNPATSVFTLQVENNDGTRRTIAQSLMTRDKDIKTNIAEVVEEMQKGGTKMIDIVSDEVLLEDNGYASADNVEVAPNYKTNEWRRLMSNVYSDFFHEYMKRYAKSDNFHADHVPIGQGYSDALTDLPKKPNTFAPEAPVGYSDKLHDEVFVLDVKNEYGDEYKQIFEHAKPEHGPDLEITVRGVDHLDFTDTLPIAYLEGKAYSDNESLMAYLHNMENALIAKDINNAAKGRPNMSFKYTDENGKVRGYLLAYEGTLDNSSVDELDGKPVIYIADLASDRENVRAGGSLIKAFVEQYKREYLEKGNMVPVFMEAREQTSYRIVKRQIERISKDLDIELIVEELPTYQSGGDTMHPVVIRPKQTRIA